jgi:hypothetical protein
MLPSPFASNRRFIRHLIASPLIAASGVSARGDELIGKPGEAVNVFELASVAEKRISAAHWA